MPKLPYNACLALRRQQLAEGNDKNLNHLLAATRGGADTRQPRHVQMIRFVV